MKLSELKKLARELEKQGYRVAFQHEVLGGGESPATDYVPDLSERGVPLDVARETLSTVQALARRHSWVNVAIVGPDLVPLVDPGVNQQPVVRVGEEGAVRLEDWRPVKKVRLKPEEFDEELLVTLEGGDNAVSG